MRGQPAGAACEGSTREQHERAGERGSVTKRGLLEVVEEMRLSQMGLSQMGLSQKKFVKKIKQAEHQQKILRDRKRTPDVGLKNAPTAFADRCKCKWVHNRGQVKEVPRKAR